jgi:hypothetical protein
MNLQGSRDTHKTAGYVCQYTSPTAHGKTIDIRECVFLGTDDVQNQYLAVQEELAGTTWDTMRRVYDFVDVTTPRDAVALLEADTTPAPHPVKRRGGLKKAA